MATGDKYVIIVTGGFWNDEKKAPVSSQSEATIFTDENVYKTRRKLIKKYSQVFVKVLH
ncbi:MAG: hypothetical protein IJ772_04690 [Bacilli bacterium]|nr:hypothetical protein [Bacilli bacterium]